MVMIQDVPAATHRGEEDLPWVQLGPQLELKVAQVNPAGSVHTLVAPEDNTEVTDIWFAIYGANLNLGADGNVESVVDAAAILQVYLAICASQGLPRPDVIGAPAAPSGR